MYHLFPGEHGLKQAVGCAFMRTAPGWGELKIEKTGTGAETETLYLGPVEIRAPRTASEEVLLYPLPNLQIIDGDASAVHADQLGSVRVITDVSGAEEANASTPPSARSASRPPPSPTKPTASSENASIATAASCISTPATTIPSWPCSSSPIGSR
jgi:hypothetical protein